MKTKIYALVVVAQLVSLSSFAASTTTCTGLIKSVSPQSGTQINKAVFVMTSNDGNSLSIPLSMTLGSDPTSSQGTYTMGTSGNVPVGQFSLTDGKNTFSGSMTTYFAMGTDSSYLDLDGVAKRNDGSIPAAKVTGLLECK